MATATFIHYSFVFKSKIVKFSPKFEASVYNSSSFRSKSSLANNQKSQLLPIFSLGQRNISVLRKRLGVIRASSSDSVHRADAVAPLQLESPVGQFLTEILVSHPHLVPAAVEQQLEQLQTERDNDKKEDTPGSGSDIVLYRRIAEVKANERKEALEEILYALIVQKFVESDVSLVPSVSPSSSDQSGRVDTWPIQNEKLERLHSPEAYDMIQNHLALILGNRSGEPTSVAQISKLRIGQVYAASVIYGYFLKRVDQRFQLEKTMKILPEGSGNEEVGVQQSLNEMRNSLGEDTYKTVNSHPEVSSWVDGVSRGGFAQGIKSSRLRNYVMSFDGDTLQRYATLRSKEADSIIEKHTEALFGSSDIVITPEGTIDSSSDEYITISLGGLRRLLLEAVTFGSFLWDVESYVDSRYQFVVV